jgi:myo-inositol-1-phosphate synthase
LSKGLEIGEPTGKLGVMLVGLGAVSTTLIAGVEAVKLGLAKPFGSLTQMATIRLGKRTERRTPLIKDFVPLADLADLVFGAWDIFPDDAFVAASKAAVLDQTLLKSLEKPLRAIKPMKAAFDQRWVKRLTGTHVKVGRNKKDLADQIAADIGEFRASTGASRLVMIWCGSTEAHTVVKPEHETITAFEKALEENSPEISPSMIYAYASLAAGVPFANAAPNLCIDTPALVEMAKRNKVPIAGKDLKTGQTLMKTIIAPGFKARMLGVRGWYSTNILGNRDGEVLDDPESFKSKEESKLGVLQYILQPDLYPELYGDIRHQVRIDYYPPRGDNKEGWDNIDIFGWLGYPMQIKINFLCRDSILAAPVVLDLALFTDLAQRSGMKGIQEWLSFYFKSPMTAPGLYPEHDLFIQLMKLKNTLRYLRGEELITHLGLEYYD